MARIDISFKNTKRDRKLYNFLIDMEDRSHILKEALRDYFFEELKTEGNSEKSKIKKKEIEKEIIDITDF